MSVTAAALRELHHIHQRLADLRDRLERGPKQVRAREANVKQLEAKVAEARDRAKQMQMALDRKQLDLKSGEQKVMDLRVKLNGANSNREYQSFLEQIAAAEMAGSVLSDEILEGMEKVDELHLLTKEAEKNLASGKQEMEKSKQGVESSAATIRSDVAQLEIDLAEAERGLPADLKADYERVVRSKGADSLSAADDGVCLGCGQQITLNMQNELRLSKLVFCKSCGRLLYLPAENEIPVIEPAHEFTPDMQRKHELHAYVESGKRTVKQVLDRFNDEDWVVRHIGYRVNIGAWTIAGASPNGGGFGGKKGDSYKTRLNEQLGREIGDRCAEQIIEVRDPFKPKEGFELSSLLSPET